MASSNAKSQQSEHGIHDMISKLTDRLVSFGQGTAEHENSHNTHHDADQGVGIITLAGENKGAAMKAASLDELVDTQGMIYNDEDFMSVLNSNYQAVNNSIMLEGSCIVEDPGVHIIMAENLDDGSSSDDSNNTDSDSDSEESDEEDKKGKKGKKKESKKKNEGKKKKEGKKKETPKKEHHSESEKEEEGKHTE
jgi:hypothetical protein